MSHRVYDLPLLGFECDACHGGRLGDPPLLRSLVHEQQFVCPACQHRRPTELAYFGALRAFPFTNCLTLANSMERGQVDLPLGRSGAVSFSQEFSRLLYVNAQPHAEFPVQHAIQRVSRAGFTLQLAATDDPPSAAPIRVGWVAAGFRGPTLPLFLDLLIRPFQALHLPVVETELDYRLVVMEAVIAFEAFAAWYLEANVWKHDHFAGSKQRRGKLQQLIKEAGIANLTEVPVRLAVDSAVDLYRVFSLLQLPVRGGLLTTDALLSPILTGIRVRNDIAHKGRTHVDRHIAEELLASVYFLIEAVLLSSEAARPEEEGGVAQQADAADKALL